MPAVLRRLRDDPSLGLRVLAIAAVVAIYGPAIGRGLVNYDDTMLIRDNWVVQSPSWSSLSTVFFDLHSPARFALSPEYLPIRDLSVMADFAIWGHWYGGFHLTNLVLYIAAILLWFEAFAAFGVDRTIAALAVLLWAIHPAHAESVAWLSERKGLLGATFCALTALGFARFRTGRPHRWLAFAVVAAVLAVWSKATAAFGIAAIAGLELVLPAGRVSWRRSVAGLAMIAIAAGLAFIPVLSLATSSDVVGLDVHAPVGRVPLVLGSLGLYARLGAMTATNAISYPLATDGPTALDLALGVAMVALLAAAFAIRRTPSELRAAAVLWLVTWLPVSHLVLPLQMVVVADRYLLLPTLGVALAAAAGLVRIPGARARTLLVGTLVLAAGFRAFDAQDTWRDDMTLWERAVRSNPNDAQACSAYAQALIDAGHAEDAIGVVHGCLEHVDTPRLRLREALLVIMQGKRAQGVAMMRKVAETHEPRAMSDLALLIDKDGLHDEALRWARDVAREFPSYMIGLRTHGKLALAAGLNDEALAAFRAAYALDPHDATNNYNLALALRVLHRDAEAAGHLFACANDPAVGYLCRGTLERAPR